MVLIEPEHEGLYAHDLQLTDAGEELENPPGGGWLGPFGRERIAG
jgi:hypothetical protein